MKQFIHKKRICRTYLWMIAIVFYISCLSYPQMQDEKQRSDIIDAIYRINKLWGDELFHLTDSLGSYNQKIYSLSQDYNKKYIEKDSLIKSKKNEQSKIDKNIVYEEIEGYVESRVGEFAIIFSNGNRYAVKSKMKVGDTYKGSLQQIDGGTNYVSQRGERMLVMNYQIVPGESPKRKWDELLKELNILYSDRQVIMDDFRLQAANILKDTLTIINKKIIDYNFNLGSRSFDDEDYDPAFIAFTKIMAIDPVYIRNKGIQNKFNEAYRKCKHPEIYIITVNTYKPCQVALISEYELLKNDFKWWYLWDKMKSNSSLVKTPGVLFAPPGRNVLVVYDPSATYDPNGASNGIVIEDLIVDGIRSNTYNFNKEDFKKWHCLSCPWLYIYNGSDFVRIQEVLKDVIGKQSCKTDYIKLPTQYMIDKNLKILLKEEKDEITFIDGISIIIDGEELLPIGADSRLFIYNDQEYYILRKGEERELNFNLDNYSEADEITLKIRGYYEPSESMVQSYLKQIR